MTFDGRWRHGNSEIIIKLKLSPHSPLLIQAPKEENSDNKIEALSYKKGDSKFFYIPGSSLKGVFRARSEKIFYHLRAVVDPGSDDDKKKLENAEKFYNELNAVNQLFGHQIYRGRLTFDDAIFDKESVEIETRTNIAVDRFRGGSKDGALFETECLVEGQASTTISLKNPDSWQIVWLCFLIRDLQKGHITVGAKEGIGFGRLNVEIEEIAFHLYNKELEKEWKNLLSKGSRRKSLYPIYTFESLDTVATSLESDWTEFLKQASGKVGVDA